MTANGLKKFEQHLNKTFSDAKSRGFQSQFDSAVEFGKDIINMNDGYLLSILKIMEEYNILKVHGVPTVGKNNPDYYYQLWELLWNMRDLLDPKIKSDMKSEIDKEMMGLYNSIETIFTSGGDGMLMSKKGGMLIRIKLGKVYRKFLNIMNDQGMLTHVPQDPGTAMSKFTE